MHNSFKALGAEFRVNLETAGGQSQPDVTRLRNGFAVAWPSNGLNGGPSGVFAQRYNKAGQRQGQVFKVNPSDATHDSQPAAKEISGGRLVVAWMPYYDSLPDGFDIHARIFTPAGAPETAHAISVNAETFSGQYEARIASLGQAGFVVVWYSRHEGGNTKNVYMRRFDLSGMPLGRDERVNTSSGSQRREPDVAARADGSFMVVWANYDLSPGGRTIRGQVYDPQGNRVKSEFRIDMDASAKAGSPRIAALSGGGYAVVWDERFGQSSDKRIVGRLLAGDGAFVTDTFPVNANEAGIHRTPALAALSDGGFAVAWTVYDDIALRRFDAQGRGGPEIIANTHRPGGQSQASLAAYSSDSLVVCWSSNEQDGDGFGVYGQRFRCD
jgi:hypothetical protein